jgi:transposase
VPWDVRGTVELRLEFVKRVIVGGESISRLCEEYGVSRPTGYLWLKRYQETGKIQSLVDRSHRPKTCPNRTDERIEARVIELRTKYGWGADKLKALLAKEDKEFTCVANTRILMSTKLILTQRNTHKFNEYNGSGDLKKSSVCPCAKIFA